MVGRFGMSLGVMQSCLSEAGRLALRPLQLNRAPWQIPIRDNAFAQAEGAPAILPFRAANARRLRQAE